MVCGLKDSSQIRRALKVGYGKQDARRHGVFPDGLPGKLAYGFHFEVAPLTSGCASLNQPVDFTLQAAGKLAPAFTAAAGCGRCGLRPLDLCESREGLCSLRGGV